MNRRTLLFAAFVSSIAFAQTPQPAPSAPPVIIKAGRILDVKSGTYLEGQSVLVRGGNIDAVGPAASLQSQAPDAKIIDLGNATLLPGLIDCHTHLLQNYDFKLNGDDPNMTLTVATMSPAKRALLGARMGLEDLEAGITTVRDLGNSGVNGDVALRDAIRAGWVKGPRMAVSTRALSAAGGQFGELQSAAQNLVAQEYVVVSNPDEARAAVQQAFYDGADLIKVIVNTGRRVLTGETMKAIVDETHRLHAKVAAHAIGDDATRIAADAGADSIEHAYTVPDDVLKTMAAKHIYLVPTDTGTGSFKYFINAAATPEERKRQEEAMKRGFERTSSRLRRAIAAGVPIAFGSDEYYQFPGLTRGEATLLTLDSYIESGMTALQVIQSATINAADLIGVQHLGLIEKGKAADIIAVIGDPLKDAGVLQKVKFVMKQGEVYRNDISH
ncbi:MAG: amidohydrolase family protein [Terriglobales bacterium]